MTSHAMDRREFAALALSATGMTAFATPRPQVPTAQQGAWTPLWNGRDLEGWTTWMQRPEPTSDVPGLTRGADGRYTEPIGSNRDPLRVFTVVPEVDGKPAIRISGEAFGELRSARVLEDYHLTLQFKWGQKKWPPRDAANRSRDTGLLYHVHAGPGEGGRLWARSIEFQIQEGDTGDLYAVGSAIAVRAATIPGTTPAEYVYNPNGPWTYFSQIAGQTGRCIKQPDAERPTGEWNTLELICLGQRCIHVVNGKVVMRLLGPTRIMGSVPTPVTSGAIILQSEGAEVFYRDVMMRSITAIPSEYAE
jgi:hypothetical protein